MIPLATVALLCAQEAKQQQQPPQGQDELKRERPGPKPGAVAAPPEEDTSIAVTEYSFNPLQSEKEISVGNQYYKLGNYRAAQRRFQEATKWNDGNSHAWLRLGEAAEKTKDRQIAKEAYAKFLKIEPEAKNAPEIRKRVEKLK